MKFTINWLKTHLSTDASNAEIIDTLTMIGLEVEEVIDQAKILENFTIAKVIEAKKHPNADKLQVLLVDDGKGGEPIKVVCGAPNAKTGMMGVFASTGTYIPGADFTLKKGNIRGEESNGMMCSEKELLLSDDHDGIIELPADTPLGVKYVDYMKIDDVMIDVAITPNRGDCASVFGIARDLSATGLGNLKDEPIKAIPASAGETTTSIELRFDDEKEPACPLFAGRLIKNIQNVSSPNWLQQRLRDIGLRPINALVDITNFITYDRGRPLHVFDADKISGTLHARMGKQGEKLEALDNKSYEIDEIMCVIADDSGAIGLGGIMGGTSTSSDENTTNVLLECAWFDPINIAKTGRKTGINSDARYRFERYVDPSSTRDGIELATKLILEICGGEACEIKIAGEKLPSEKIISFPLAEIERLTGLKISYAEIKVILTRLGFWLSGSGEIVKIAVPTWRPDIEQKADIVEEVMRMVGVDKIPVEPLPSLDGVAKKMLTSSQNNRRLARRALATRGLKEAITYSFISQESAKLFGGGDKSLRLANAIANDMSDMRPSLLPSLLRAASRNINRGFADGAIFEVGQIFLDDSEMGQKNYASAIRYGSAKINGAGRHWQSKVEKLDVYDIKADLAAMFDVLGQDIEKAQIIAEPAIWAHPGRSARVQLGPKNILGHFGEIHPSILAKFDLEGPIVAFEANLDALPKPRKKATKSKPPIVLSDLMALKRDFAFVLDKDIEGANIIKAAKNANKAMISQVNIFDVFEGGSLDKDKKSIAIEVIIQPKDKTLTDEEIEIISAAIIKAVEKATGAILRS
ncbi:MAG: phenylalanine--tRNA ligase subunit beta [Devosiaceae bacterium]|nr:phenylalanine--tRNA ligase subunit beta [Devosiaceae bacterium]